MSEVKRYESGVHYCSGDAMVQEDDGYYVKYSDYAALKAERDALAVECAQYKSMAERMAERADDYKSEHFGYSVFDSSNEIKQYLKTPATDAYLNSVRADGVEMFENWLRESANIFDANARSEWADKNRVAADKAREFAANLRKENGID